MRYAKACWKEFELERLSAAQVVIMLACAARLHCTFGREHLKAVNKLAYIDDREDKPRYLRLSEEGTCEVMTTPDHAKKFELSLPGVCWVEKATTVLEKEMMNREIAAYWSRFRETFLDIRV